MVGEPTTFTKGWFDAWPDAADATPLLAAARAIKTDAGDRADAARERDLRGGDGARARRAAARDEGERGGGALAGVRPRRGHGLAATRSSSRSASRSSGRAPGSRRSPPPATGPCQADEPTLFEIWVCADGYWCDHTKLLCPGELRADYRELEAELLEVYERRDRPLPAGREPRRARPADPRRASPRPAIPASRRTRSATASARGRTSRRTRTRPAAARSPRAWCSRSSRAATGRAAAACASRTTS